MPPLDHPVSLRVVWRRADSAGPEHPRQSGEKGRLELCPLVRGDSKRRAVSADPMLVESCGHRARLYVPEGDSNRPPRETVDDREGITKVSNQRHGDYVQMYVVETAVRDLNVVRNDLVVPMDLRPLTWDALARPAKRVSLDSGPDELFPEPSGSDSATGVCQAVDDVESPPTEALRKIWPHDASRDVAPNGVRADRQRLEREGRVRACRLQLSILLLGGLDGRCVQSGWHVHRTHAGQGVRDDVVLAVHVDDSRGILGDEIQLALLPARGFVQTLGEGVHQWTVVRPDDERSAFNNVFKILN